MDYEKLSSQKDFLMRLNVSQGNLAEQTTDCLVVNLFEGVTTPGGATGALSHKALAGALRTSIARSRDFTGKAGTHC